ncbi:MAG: hydroxymethylbilane synthase, partial [Saprospiraceae bacterium]|nr:hydroxymethylbilane synthase [Saprospiraceae bacterium]
MSAVVKVGTRGSKLALWQAQLLQNALHQHGVRTERIVLETRGDIDQETPLDNFDEPGVFTNVFDEALLHAEIDIAVHSLKDYPAAIPDGITLGAFLKRGNPVDTLVLRVPLTGLVPGEEYIIATSSSRRRAQWLRRFPGSTTEPIRGNVPTRLAKLYESGWDGAILARAGLQRLGIQPPHTIDLGWMVPAPGQGIITAACRSDDTHIRNILSKVNDGNSEYCASLERAFMRHLGGGCEAPIGALATAHNGHVHFKGCVLAEDGSEEISVDMTTEARDPEHL